MKKFTVWTALAALLGVFALAGFGGPAFTASPTDQEQTAIAMGSMPSR